MWLLCSQSKCCYVQQKVILVRNGDRTTITMSNDFQGDIKDFAMVVPIPNVIERSDIRVLERSIFNALGSYSAPRLVEYYDQDPCGVRYYTRDLAPVPQLLVVEDAEIELTAEENDYQVTIEATYSVEEYEILVLSAKESSGLKNWLLDNGYKIPAKAEEVLDPYIKNGLKFFVVKVNLEEYNQRQFQNYLRPLQLTVQSDRFMLPIRLGMANANGDQDMLVYTLSKKGRVETTNYKTEKVPSNINVPTFIKEKFEPFYKRVFDQAHDKTGRNAVMLEYAWTVTPSWGGVKCDPCVGNPPYYNELQQAGVDWLNTGEQVFFTRLHVKYSRSKFPEDLFFQETPNTEHFQCRYVLQHSVKGETKCSEAAAYWQKVRKRRRTELLNMANITGWDPLAHNDYIFTGTTNNEVQFKRGSIVPYWFNTKNLGLKLSLFGFVSLLIIHLGKKIKNRFNHSNI
ncbi:DUF2330 domain-containing protein [bacterium]|nr:DUF2330 domain-containing protein [bacterium]